MEHALMLDSVGVPISHDDGTRSRDWHEVQEFCRSVYMPCPRAPTRQGVTAGRDHDLGQGGAA